MAHKKKRKIARGDFTPFSPKEAICTIAQGGEIYDPFKFTPEKCLKRKEVK